MQIAETAIKAKFPNTFEAHKPYRAQLEDGVWLVRGTLSDGAIGGVPQARIRDLDGRVIEVLHTQ